MDSQLTFTKYLKKNQYQFFSSSSKKLKRREHFQIQPTRPALLFANDEQGHFEKRKLQADIPSEHRCKTPRQNIRKLGPTAH